MPRMFSFRPAPPCPVLACFALPCPALFYSALSTLTRVKNFAPSFFVFNPVTFSLFLMKNKEMFFYFSLLVERHIFDEISMGFLIVGHTHSSIDQFFSVLCNAIEASKFIGSPMALHELYSKCSNDQRMIPKRQRQIRVEFDYVSAFKPYLNKNIMYYNVPHNFLFRCV